MRLKILTVFVIATILAGCTAKTATFAPTANTVSTIDQQPTLNLISTRAAQTVVANLTLSAPTATPITPTDARFENTPSIAGGPLSAPTPTVSEGETISIVGIVQDVSLSAKVIRLKEPIQDFSYLALLQDSKLVSSDGINISLMQVQPGMRVKATGRPGTQGTLIALELSILP
jgi:hypothetical protein